MHNELIWNRNGIGIPYGRATRRVGSPTDRSAASLPSSVTLLTGHYNCKNLKKTREIKKCILANALNFDYVIVLFENWDEVKEDPEYKYLTNTSNIQLVKSSFPNYEIYFEYACSHLKDTIVVISCSDTLFDRDVNKLNKILETDMRRDSLIVLQRLQALHKNNLCSLFKASQTKDTAPNENYQNYSYVFNPSLLNTTFGGQRPCDEVGAERVPKGIKSYLENTTIIKNINDIIKTYHIDFADGQIDQTDWMNQGLATNPSGAAQARLRVLSTNYSGDQFIKKNIFVITYCLWGKNEKYYQNIENNISDALQFYPDMTVVLIVHEPSVDFDRLKFLDDWPNVALIKRHDNYGTVLNMTWRFEILDNPHVHAVLARDLDSLILKREVMAVREWLKSTKRVHIMRDHPCHFYKMLGGLIGLQKMPYLDSMASIIAKYKSRGNEFEIDQKILRAEIYPKCCAMNDVFVHASFHAHEIFAKPFPIDWDETYHFVGAYLENTDSALDRGAEHRPAPQKYFTDLLRNKLQTWTKGIPHKNIEIIKVDKKFFTADIYEAVNAYKENLENKSYCLIMKNYNTTLYGATLRANPPLPSNGRVAASSPSDLTLHKLINISYLHDDEKILIDVNKKWIIFHSKVLHSFLQSIDTYLEKTGNLITIDFKILSPE